MDELEKVELRLIEKSIDAVTLSIKDIQNLDIENAINMYNIVLSGFESLQKNHKDEDSEKSIVQKKLVELEEEHKKVIEIFESGDIDILPSTIENKVLKKYQWLKEYYKEKIFLKENNINIDGKFYNQFKNVGLLKNIDIDVINQVQSYWEKHYKKKIDTSLHLAFYNQTGKIEPRLIPQEVLNLDIIPILNGLNFNGFYSDKNIYDLLINADSCPEVVLKRVNGQYFNGNNRTISRTDAFQLFFEMKEDLIVKQSRSDDGKSVEKIKYRSHAFYYKNKKVDLIYIEKHWGMDFIIQRVLKQHPMMAAPHKYSVNTFRMVTLRWNNKINYLMTYARFGANQEVKDNGGEGGIVIAVSPEGEFSNFGMGHDGKIYTSHPTTGFEFKNFQRVPNFDEYISFVTNLHNRILHHNYVSWDIAMGLDGKPIFIEMNFRGPVWKYQLVTEKPIFGEFTEDILDKAVKERDNRNKQNKQNK